MLRITLAIICSLVSILLSAQKIKVEYIGYQSFLTYEDHKPPIRKANFTLFLDGVQSYGYGEILISEDDTTSKKTKNSKTTEVFKDLKKDELIFKTRLIGANKISYFSDSLHQFNWIITTIQKKIDSLTVYKAMCIWRGRTYTAWFAPSLSYSNGPEKFGGLPGLIVEIYSDGNEFYRRMKSFSKFDFTIPTFPKVEGDHAFMVKTAKEYFAKFLEKVTALEKVDPNCKNCKQSSEIVAIDLEFTLVL